MNESRLLAPEELCRRCDPAQFPFATTAELADGIDIIGQERALEAARFAVGIKRPGFNLFVLGEPGSGRHQALRRLLDAKAAEEPVPDDWCYVNNFSEPERPRLLRLPAGMGQRLRQDMQQFIAELGPAITATFESDEFHSRIESIQEEFKGREEGALRELGSESRGQGVALIRTPQGFVFAPMKGDETLSSDEFEQLADDEKQRIGKLMEQYGERLHKLMHQFPRWRREAQGRVRAASREALALATGHLIEELKESYKDFPNVLEFLDAAIRDIVEIDEDIRDQSRGDGDSVEIPGTSLSLRRYQVNLLIDHSRSSAAPVVFEDSPIYANLVGRVEQIAQMGVLVTNFSMIRAGALHRANGGYLMLDALKVLMQPYAWEGLKRALKARQVRIESLGQVYGLVSTQSLEPEPVPLEVKVVLFGDRYTYYALRELDPEFGELFKVSADFENEVSRDGGNSELYARLISTVARRDGLKPFDAGAVARVVEHAARMAGDAEKLSACTRRIVDVLHEADHRAQGRQSVSREDVDTALAARRERAGRLRRAVHEYILRGIQLIDVTGSRIGQVNGLSVFDPGDDEMFGHPVRITATARLGEGDVVDIEREAELGGAIHSKGVMILSSFLGARYARSQPLSLAASLVFEQSYGPVEGDSASLAELCALLSALAEVPIKQSLAVTGSVNQHGRVQAIGGVNEKIEGFFDVCKARGLDGEQGVVIPTSNVAHLMLNDEVVAACAAGRFHVWAVDSVDAAIGLLTGIPAGEPGVDGVIPAGSINYLVAVRLAEMSELRLEFGGTTKKAKKKDSGG